MNSLFQKQYPIKNIKSCPIMMYPDKQMYISKTDSNFKGFSQEFGGMYILLNNATQIIFN